MPITTFEINGVNIEDYGLAIVDASGFLNLPARRLNVVQPIQRDASVVVEQANYVEPRSIVLRSYIKPSSISDRRVKLNALRKALRGTLAIKTVEDSTKVIYGRLVSGATTPAGRWFLTPEVEDEITIVCHDPMWYDATLQSTTFAALNTDYTIPMGSAPIRRIRVKLDGSWSGTITCTMKNGTGTVIQTMSSTFAAAGGEYLEFQCDPAGPKVRSYSGSFTDRIGTLGSTETFFVAYPEDAPTLRIDKGALTSVFEVYRAWEA